MRVGLRPICWLNACFRAPLDWEIVAYSIESRAGRLEFATRHGHQGQFAWEPSAHAPDLDALFAAFPTQAGQVRKGERYQTAEAGRFTLGWGDPEKPCLAVGYLAGSKKLLRWVFPKSDSTVRKTVIVPILASVEPNDAAWPRTLAFGLDFRIAAEYQLERARVMPADVEMLFESKRKARAFFHRWGLPEALLAGLSLEAFYTRILQASGARVRDARRIEIRGMEAVEASYSQTGEHQLDRFMGRAWNNGIARIWHDRETKRLLAFEQIAPDGVDLLPFESVFGEPRA